MYQQEKDVLMDGSMTERENNGNSWAVVPPEASETHSVSDSNFLPEPPGPFKISNFNQSCIQTSLCSFPDVYSLP